MIYHTTQFNQVMPFSNRRNTTVSNWYAAVRGEGQLSGIEFSTSTVPSWPIAAVVIKQRALFLTMLIFTPSFTIRSYTNRLSLF